MPYSREGCQDIRCILTNFVDSDRTPLAYFEDNIMGSNAREVPPIQIAPESVESLLNDFDFEDSTALAKAGVLVLGLARGVWVKPDGKLYTLQDEALAPLNSPVIVAVMEEIFYSEMDVEKVNPKLRLNVIRFVLSSMSRLEWRDQRSLQRFFLKKPELFNGIRVDLARYLFEELREERTSPFESPREELLRMIVETSMDLDEITALVNLLTEKLESEHGREREVAGKILDSAMFNWLHMDVLDLKKISEILDVVKILNAVLSTSSDITKLGIFSPPPPYRSLYYCLNGETDENVLRKVVEISLEKMKTGKPKMRYLAVEILLGILFDKLPPRMQKETVMGALESLKTAEVRSVVTRLIDFLKIGIERGLLDPVSVQEIVDIVLQKASKLDFKFDYGSKTEKRVMTILITAIKTAREKGVNLDSEKVKKIINIGVEGAQSGEAGYKQYSMRITALKLLYSVVSYIGNLDPELRALIERVAISNSSVEDLRVQRESQRLLAKLRDNHEGPL